MIRKDWTFEYTAAKLAEAAKAQKEFRTDRVKVWEEKKIEVMARIKESGLTVHEDLADVMSSSNKYQTQAFGGPQVTSISRPNDAEGS